MANQPKSAERPPLHPPLVLKARELEGFDGGIGIADVGEDLAIRVYAWLDMAAGQRLALYLNDDPEPLLIWPILEGEENQDQLLSIERRHLFARTLQIHYCITDINTQPSERYRLLIKLDRPGGVDPDPETDISEGLQAPLVPEEIARFGVGPEHLAAGVEVTIPPFYNRSPVQRITLYWGGVAVRQQVLTDDPLAPVVITVPAAIILEAGNSMALPLFYEVHDEVNNWSGHSPGTLVKVVVRAGDLPAPEVLDAVDGFLDVAALDSRPARVEVQTPAPDFAPGDVVRLHWDGVDGDGNPVVETLDLEVEGADGLVFEVANQKVLDILHGRARVAYELRRSGVRTGLSEQITVHVIGEVRLRFEVFGARSSRGPYYYATPSRLVARSSAGTVHWQYLGDAAGEDGESFIDTAPEKPLQVTYRSARDDHTEVLLLRPGNVSGVLLLGSHDSGCLVKNDGSLFGWGDAGSPLLPPADVTDVVHVSGGGQAYAALTRGGQVRAWGVGDFGGSIPPEVAPELVNVQVVAGAGRAFAALLGTGRVEAWGEPGAGGNIPAGVKANLRNVQQIIGADAGFAARQADGRVYCWGEVVGTAPGEVVAARGAVRLYASNGAFAALKLDGSVHAWGDPSQGAVAPAGMADVRQLASTSRAFAAIDIQGQIHCWGDPQFGGSQPAPPPSTPVYLLGASSAFALLLEDTTVHAWGQAAEGGEVPAGLRNVLTLTANHGGFAALREDRSWLSWGRTSGEAMPVQTHCIYQAGSTLLGLSEAGQVSGRGENAPDFSEVQGEVSYYQAEARVGLDAVIEGQRGMSHE